MRFLCWCNVVGLPVVAAYFIYGIGAGTLHADAIVWWWAFSGIAFLFLDNVKDLLTN